MISEITAKTLLSTLKQLDPWFGIKYNMNLYRGCQHQCIYCDSRSECYRIQNFSDILVKKNAIELLKKELPKKRIKGTIGLGAMNDCYMPVEDKYKLTRQALEIIAHNEFPVHIITKSKLVTRDIDILEEINNIYAAVSFTITTCDDELGKKLEPNASLVSERFNAMKQLTGQGVMTGVTLMPVLPFITDNEENISGIVTKAYESGASYIIAAFGMTLRDRQGNYYYDKLNKLFPGLRTKYESSFGNSYMCSAGNAKSLIKIFEQLCTEYGISTRLKPYPLTNNETTLFS